MKIVLQEKLFPNNINEASISKFTDTSKMFFVFVELIKYFKSITVSLSDIFNKYRLLKLNT